MGWLGATADITEHETEHNDCLLSLSGDVRCGGSLHAQGKGTQPRAKQASPALREQPPVGTVPSPGAWS